MSLVTNISRDIIATNVSTIRAIWLFISYTIRSITSFNIKLVIDAIIPYLKCDNANVDEKE